MTVNRERVQWLVDALRSDEYLQGMSMLEQQIDGVMHQCCLGVACRVAIAHGLALRIRQTEGWLSQTLFDGAGDVLPASVRDWYGFDHGNPYLLEEDGFTIYTAAGMNDNKKYNFAQIADAFERTFLRPEQEQEQEFV